MAHFHFLIDVSLSNKHFKQHATFNRLMDQIDHLAELNQHSLDIDLIGCTFFARDILQTIIPISTNELKNLLNEEIDFHIGAKDRETSQRAIEALDKLGIGETRVYPKVN